MSAVNPQLGTIKITIQRVEGGWTKTKHERPSTQQKKRFIMDESPVHESKKFLIEHRVKSDISCECFQPLTHSDRLGHPIPSEKKDAYDIQVLDPDEIPYRTFIFYYRPKGLDYFILSKLAENPYFRSCASSFRSRTSFPTCLGDGYEKKLFYALRPRTGCETRA